MRPAEQFEAGYDSIYYGQNKNMEAPVEHQPALSMSYQEAMQAANTNWSTNWYIYIAVIEKKRKFIN